jgi:hypothetical protein
MSELASANWNFQYGMDNPKNVLNKVTNFGSLPINQHYLFFKNGATSMMQNDKNILPEVKAALEKERIDRNKNDHGEGTARPAAFTETQMSDLYYNSFGLDIDIVSRPYTVDPFMIMLITGGYTGLLALLAAISISLTLQVVVDQLFSSVIKAQIPKMGYTDYYTYEKKDLANKERTILSEIVKRKHPFVPTEQKEDKIEAKIQKDQLINLSSESGFKKVTGTSSYDTILSKYQFNGGGGFTSSIFKNIEKENIEMFIETLKANSTIKYDQLNKLSSKYSDKAFILRSQEREKAILDKLKVQINSILRPISVHIDFSDYKTIVSGTRQKGYPNPQKEKSIFGPYICRSKKAFLYYPKIIIQDTVMSTLGIKSNGVPYTGALDLFGVPTTAYNIALPNDLSSMELILRMASYNILPQLFGGCKLLGKDSAFNLGAGDIGSTKSKANSTQAASTC